jgi:sterol desaturase/sphingolipid hydroxylase (fatty acid hydroxylase superfamily)
MKITVMRLSRVGYYSEFIIYPVLAVGLLATAAWRYPERAPLLVATLVGGLALWTLVEYVLHRFVLHHVPYIKEMHDAHHDDQEALIGTPVWLSLLIFLVFVFAPLWLLTDPVITAGLSAGMVVGYFFYGGVHHLIHHTTGGPGSFGYKLKRRHALHHHYSEEGNFGVTTGFWDVVFGTDVQRQLRARKTQPADVKRS